MNVSPQFCRYFTNKTPTSFSFKKRGRKRVNLARLNGLQVSWACLLHQQMVSEWMEASV